MTKCQHITAYYSAEADNFYCQDCRKGMGIAYYNVAKALLKTEQQKQAMQAEPAAVRQEIETLSGALEEISQFCECDGPGCEYCESSKFHPPSAEAKIAQKALKDAKHV